jgi:hypothetical protein
MLPTSPCEAGEREMSSRTVVAGESDSLHAKMVCELVYHISNSFGGELINHARTK